MPARNEASIEEHVRVSRKEATCTTQQGNMCEVQLQRRWKTCILFFILIRVYSEYKRKRAATWVWIGVSVNTQEAPLGTAGIVYSIYTGI